MSIVADNQRTGTRRSQHPPSLPALANQLCGDVGEASMTAGEIHSLFACLLHTPELLEQAVGEINRLHFDPTDEMGIAALWEVTTDLYSACNGAPSIAAIRTELQRKLNDAQTSGIECSDLEAAATTGGVFDVLTQQTDVNCEEEYGRLMVRRFLLEREVTKPLVEITRVPMQISDRPRLPADFPTLLQRAAERSDEIESKWSADGGSRLRFVSDREFSAGNHELVYLVPGILVDGQPAVAGGPSKALKTSMMVDLGISLSSFTPTNFIGRFPVAHGKSVLFFSAESGEGSLHDTRRRVLHSKGLAGAELNLQWCFEAPKLSNRSDMAQLKRQLDRRRTDVVFFDPLYLMLLSGSTDISAASIFEMGPLFRNIAKICLDRGATPIFIHHFNRAGSISNEPPGLENLSYAGIAEFSRQWLLIGRREKYQAGQAHKLWLNCGGSAGHSSLWAVDINEGADHTNRSWSVTVNAPDEARVAESTQREREREQENLRRTVADGTRVLEVLRQQPGGEVKSGLRAALNVSPARLDAALNWLLRERRIVDTQVRRENGQRYGGYQMVAEVQSGRPESRTE